MRAPKSYSIERELAEYISITKGDGSASDRVNELLRHAILDEQYQKLEAEAAAFFEERQTGRIGTKALQKAALWTFGRD